MEEEEEEEVTTASATTLTAKQRLNGDREPVSLELPCKFLTSVTERAAKGTLVAPTVVHQSPQKSLLTCCLLAANLLSAGGQSIHFTLPQSLCNTTHGLDHFACDLTQGHC